MRLLMQVDIGKEMELLTHENKLFEVKLHKMLEIFVKLLFRKIGQKLRLGALVNFTDAVNQFILAHNFCPIKLYTLSSAQDYALIVTQIRFSLARILY